MYPCICYAELEKKLRMLCRPYCARAVVLVATHLHIQQGGFGSSVCLHLKHMDIFSAVSVPTTTIDHSFLAICPGVSPKDTTIIALLNWAASKVQRCVCVYLYACVNVCPLILKLCPPSTLFLPRLLHKPDLIRPLSITRTKPTCMAFRVLQAFSIH